MPEHSKTRRRPPLPVCDVSAAVGLPVEGGQAKVDHVDHVGLAAAAQQKILWLHVPIDEAAPVDGLESVEDLRNDNEPVVKISSGTTAQIAVAPRI